MIEWPVGCADAVDRPRVVTVASLGGLVLLKFPPGEMAEMTIGQNARLQMVLGMAQRDAHRRAS